MAYRFSRAVRSIFGTDQQPPPSPVVIPPDTISEGSRYDTDGSSYEEEIRPVEPSQAQPQPHPHPSNPSELLHQPSNHHSRGLQRDPPPPHPSLPTDTPVHYGTSPQNLANASASKAPAPVPAPLSTPPRAPIALRRLGILSTPVMDEGEQSSHYSLRPRRRRGGKMEEQKEPPGVETSQVAREEARQTSVNQLTASATQPADTLHPPSFLGPRMPAPSAGTTSAIAGRPELVDLGDLETKNIRELRTLCSRMGLDLDGSIEEVRERVKQKLEEKRVKEDCMIVDAYGVPRTPAREVGYQVRKNTEGHITTTIVNRRVSAEKENVVMSKCGGGLQENAQERNIPVGAGSNADPSLHLDMPVHGNNPTMLASAKGCPTISMTGIGAPLDLPASPAYIPQIAGNQNMHALATGVTPPPGVVGKAGGDPTESVDSRGGPHAINAQKVLQSLAAGNRVLNQEEYDTCMMVLTDSVAAHGDKGSAAVVSRGGSGAAVVQRGERTSGVEHVQIGLRNSNTSGAIGFSLAKASGGQTDRAGCASTRPPQFPPAPPNTPGLMTSTGVVMKGAQLASGGYQPLFSSTVRQAATALRESTKASERMEGVVGKDGRSLNPVADNVAFHDNSNMAKAGEGRGKSDVSSGKGVHRGNVKQAFQTNAGQVDITSERNIPTAVSPNKPNEGKRNRAAHRSSIPNASTGGGGEKQKDFMFNLTVVDKKEDVVEGAAHTPFRGAFAGAEGGPSVHNTIALNGTKASEGVPSQAMSAPNGKGRRDVDISTRAKEPSKPEAEDNQEDIEIIRKPGYATPREILRMFNNYGRDSETEDINRRQSIAGRQENDGDRGENGNENFRSPSSLPRHLRGFASMRNPRRSSLRSADSSDRSAGLSSFRPRRPMSTASAGIFVNLRNASSAPENKHMANKLRGSLNERTTRRPPLSASALRILDELKKVREENRSLRPHKRSLSPMPIPPSVAKRMRLAGQFNLNAAKPDAPSQNDEQIRHAERDQLRSAALTPIPTRASSLYPPTPLRPLPRAKEPAMKKRRSVAYGRGKKRANTSFSDAAVSDLKYLVEKSKDTDEKKQNFVKLDFTQAGTPNSSLKTSDVVAPTKGTVSLNFRSNADGEGTSSTIPKAQPTSFTAGAGAASAGLFPLSSAAPAPVIQPPSTVEAGSLAKTPAVSLFKPPSGSGVADESGSNPAMFGSRVLQLSKKRPIGLDDAVDAGNQFSFPGPKVPVSSKEKPFGQQSGYVQQSAPFNFGGAPTSSDLNTIDNSSIDATVNKEIRSNNENGKASDASRAITPQAHSEGLKEGLLVKQNEGKARQENREAIGKVPEMPPSSRDGLRDGQSKNEKATKFPTFGASALSKAPAFNFGQPTSAVSQEKSAYDLFNNQNETVSNLEPRQGKSTEPATTLAPSAVPVSSFGGSEGTSKPSLFGTAKPATDSAERTTIGPEKNLGFGLKSKEAVSASAFAVSSASLLETKTNTGFAFGTSPVKSGAEKSTTDTPSQGFALNTSASVLPTAPSAATSGMKEAAAGSLFSAPLSKPFAAPAGQIVGYDQKNDQPTFSIGEHNVASSLLSKTNVPSQPSEGVNPPNPFPSVLAPAKSKLAPQIETPASVFGILPGSSGSQGASLASFSVQPAAEQKSTNPSAALHNSNPFGIGHNESKPSDTPSAMNPPPFGHTESQAIAQPAEVSVPSATPSFGKPFGSFGNTGAESSTGQVAGGFPFGSTGHKVDKDASGPFGGPKFKPFGSIPNRSTFVFGATPAPQLSAAAGNAVTGLASSVNAVPSFGVQVPATSFGSSQSAFGSAPAFGSGPTFGSSPAFGSTATAAKSSVPFGSVLQAPSVNVNPFNQSQAGVGGGNMFGSSQPAFGGGMGSLPNPGFGGFGNAGGNQNTGFGNAGALAPAQGNANQFGAAPSLPAFGGTTGAGNLSFNMGMNQAPVRQQTARPRGRRILRGRRINR